jgi:hypothetical protein
MGMLQDYAAMRKAWSSFTPLTKLFFAASFLVTTMSIASLAEDVAKFRGFIVTAVVFYRGLTRPLARMLDVRQMTVDVYVLMLVIIGAQFRATLVAKDRHLPRRGEFRLIALVVATIGAAKFLARSADEQTRSGVALLAALLLILLWDGVRAYVDPGKTEFRRKLLHFLGIEDDETKRLQSRLQLSYIGAAALLVALIAAISRGLRPFYLQWGQ